jgi:hypothetical protein
MNEEDNSMAIFLGNLSLDQMQSRLGIRLSEEEIQAFPNRQDNVSMRLAPNTWHCFDIPFFIECDSMETAQRVYDIMKKYGDKMKTTIQVGIQPAEGEQV